MAGICLFFWLKARGVTKVSQRYGWHLIHAAVLEDKEKFSSVSIPALRDIACIYWQEIYIKETAFSRNSLQQEKQSLITV